MGIEISDVVCALRGRDSGKYFMVIGKEDDFVMLADGRGRRLEKPKRKKLKHITPAGSADGRTAQKLREGQKVTNAEIRRALAEHFAAEPGEKGGMHIG